MNMFCYLQWFGTSFEFTRILQGYFTGTGQSDDWPVPKKQPCKNCKSITKPNKHWK